MAHSARRIALIYDARLTYDLKVMTGVAAYLQEGHHYSVFIEENALKDQRLPDLRSWEGDGIIADFDDPAIARLVTQSRLPVVGFGGGYGWYVEGSVPYFYTNNQAIATLAADHLLDRGGRPYTSMAPCSPRQLGSTGANVKMRDRLRPLRINRLLFELSSSMFKLNSKRRGLWHSIAGSFFGPLRQVLQG